MDDNDIIQLYWDRNEQAIRITSDKYGHYCKAIARNVSNCFGQCVGIEFHAFR